MTNGHATLDDEIEARFSSRLVRPPTTVAGCSSTPAIRRPSWVQSGAAQDFRTVPCGAHLLSQEDPFTPVKMPVKVIQPEWEQSPNAAGNVPWEQLFSVRDALTPMKSPILGGDASKNATVDGAMRSFTRCQHIRKL